MPSARKTRRTDPPANSPASPGEDGPEAEAPTGPPVDAEAEEGQPRYLRIALDLKRSISDGTYPVGARMPTELELCAQFGISRFTAREAVRVLSSAGLVTRRQRVGTVVIATPGDARYTHDVASVQDLFQYANDTEVRFMFIGRVGLGRAQAAEFGAAAGDEWVYGIGLRVDVGSGGHPRVEPAGLSRPLCVTRIFLNPSLDGIEARLRGRKSGPVYAMIERDYGISIRRVEQELQAVVLSPDDAANLGAEPGAPALRILRRYYGDKGQLLEWTDNVHPSDRFSYVMQLRK